MVFNSDIHISGDVRIDDHAVIAPGVVILAAPNCSVAIAAGACLGMGCIVQADQGNIEICEGAMIGAGVLIVGSASIGENSCVGYGCTLLKTVVEAGAVLPPNSLIGDESRKVNLENSAQQEQENAVARQENGRSPIFPTKNLQAKISQPIQAEISQQKPATSDPWAAEIKPEIKLEIHHTFSPPEIPAPAPKFNQEKVQGKVETSINASPSQTAPEKVKEEPISEVPEVVLEAVIEPQVEKQTETPKEPVVGQAYINQLLMTLFPHKTPLNPSE